MAGPQINEGYVNKSLQRALALLSCFSQDRPFMSLRELSERLDVHRTTVFRLAANLISAGFLKYDASTGKYSLGLRLFELGAIFLQSTNLPMQARIFLQELRDCTNETVHMGIRDGFDVVYIEKFESPKPIKLSGFYGSRRPLYVTAMGRALLSGLGMAEAESLVRESCPLTKRTPHTTTDPEEVLRKVGEVVEKGFAYDDQETEMGLRCIASPVRDFSGAVVAAVGISGPAFRIDGATIGVLAGLVMEIGDRISREVGFSGGQGMVGK